MEHKLILGGEQYLPFARSKIKALRATGMKYASQRYVLPDAEVHVQIVGDHDYIRLSGSNVNVLSGITRGGTLTGSDPQLLAKYLATNEAWSNVLKKNPAKGPGFYFDEARLAINAHADLGISGTQYREVCASMYSGLMAKAVQLILGLGKRIGSPDGVQVRYNWRWAQCHGIVTAADGKKWLVEIGSANGIIAMRLPMIRGSAAAGSSQAVIREATALFKGVPSGGTFPADIDAAIAAGTVIRLAEASDLSAFYSKSAYSTALGWSFKMDGSEAHNTCYTDVAGVYTGYHYRINLTIGASDQNTPPATSATLTQVTSGVLKGPGRFKFWEPTTSSYVRIPNNTWSSGGAELTKTPVFVCHVDDTLEIVYHCMRHTAGATTEERSPGTADMEDYRNISLRAINPYTADWVLLTGAYAYSTYAESTSIPGEGLVGISRTVWSNLSTYGTFTFGGNLYECPAYTTTTVATQHAETLGCTLDGTRDGYVLRSESKTSDSTTIRDVHEGDSGAGVAVGIWMGYSPGGGIVGATSQTPTPGTPPYTATTSTGTNRPKIDTASIIVDGHDRINTTKTFATSGDQTTSDGVWKSTNGRFNVRCSRVGVHPQIAYSANNDTGSAVLTRGSLIGAAGYSSQHFSFLGYI